MKTSSSPGCLAEFPSAAYVVVHGSGLLPVAHHLSAVAPASASGQLACPTFHAVEPSSSPGQHPNAAPGAVTAGRGAFPRPCVSRTAPHVVSLRDHQRSSHLVSKILHLHGCCALNRLVRVKLQVDVESRQCMRHEVAILPAARLQLDKRLHTVEELLRSGIFTTVLLQDVSHESTGNQIAVRAVTANVRIRVNFMLQESMHPQGRVHSTAADPTLTGLLAPWNVLQHTA